MDRIAAAEAAALHYIRDWREVSRVHRCETLSRPEQEVFEVHMADGRLGGSVTVCFDGPNIKFVRAHLTT